jgi:hypothetical protein
LNAAVDVSKSGQDVAKQIIYFNDKSRAPAVLTPSVPLTFTPTPAPTDTPTPVASPSAAPTGESSSTPESGSTEPAVASETPATALAPTSEIVISADPVESRNGVNLYSVAAGSVKFLAPGSAEGWSLDDLPATGVPTLLKYSNSDGTSLMIIDTLNGDMYWYYTGDNGQFDEVQMRITKPSGVFVADHTVLRTAYGDASDIPWYVMQSITLIPSPTPSPTPTNTASPTVGTATATATATP